jgi:16S rRNA (cytidine1402-2'-O)-methyltransferase
LAAFSRGLRFCHVFFLSLSFQKESDRNIHRISFFIPYCYIDTTMIEYTTSEPTATPHGILFIVATPIGNLGDITVRALEILKSVDIIAAEDTRTTKFLLDHFDIRKPLISFYSYNEQRRVPDLIERLEQGQSIALVSDAGTPGISDPAYSIVRAAIENDIPVVPIPGPTAFVAALVVSGLSTDAFVFEGFLPVKKGRQTMLKRLAKEERTLILYESPHKILRTLADIQQHLGDRHVAVARELTKKFEEVLRGTVSSVLEKFSSRSIKGEFVIVIEGKKKEKK